MIAAVHSMDGVDRVEEVADQMHEREDTSSAGLVDDVGTDFHDVEVHAQSSNVADDVRARIEAIGAELGVAIEFVDEF